MTKKTMKTVRCGRCKIEVTRSEWQQHNLTTHNNLSWMLGARKTNFDENCRVLEETLENAYDQRKGNLICDQCYSMKYSVQEYLFHVKACGINRGKKTTKKMPTRSMVYNKEVSKKEEDKKHDEKSNVEEEVRLKLKRKAAERAKAMNFKLFNKDKVDKPPIKKSKPSVQTAEEKVKSEVKLDSLQKKSRTILLKRQLDRNRNQKPVPDKSKSTKKSVNIIAKNCVLPNMTTKTEKIVRKDTSTIGCKFSRVRSKNNNIIKKKSNIKRKKFTEIDLNNSKKCSSNDLSSQEVPPCPVCEGKPATDCQILKHAFQNHVDLTKEKNKNINKSLQPIRKRRKRLINGSSSCEGTRCLKKMYRLMFNNSVIQDENRNIVLDSFQWTLDFEKKYYKVNSFREYKPLCFRALNSSEIKDYLPKLKHSMLVKNAEIGNENIAHSEWKTWERFEGSCTQGNPTFFTGGPIWAMSWLPIPTSLGLRDDVSEFLAISTHLYMDDQHFISKVYSGKNIIQIWNVGNLRSVYKRDPELAYAIIHEGGTVWCLEWCPSGCYEHENLPSYLKSKKKPERMGMLAAACSDGCVRMYSLVFPSNLPQSDNESKYPIYETSPILTLVVNKNLYIENKQNWQVTRLSWTKENEHNIIAAGFSNGFVALWNLTTKSSLLKFEINNLSYLMPFRHFFAHQNSITMVYLVPSTGKKRFLATASNDRCYKFWDLEDITNPKNFIKKSFITDGAWLNNWSCAFITGDDALRTNRNFLYCLPIRDYTYKYYDMLPMNSTSFTVSANDFGNGIACGTVAGEVIAMFPHQLLNIGNMKRVLHDRRHRSVFSSIKVVDFHEEEINDKNIKNTYNFMPTTYKESESRFGLTFCDKVDFQDMWKTEPQYPKKTFKCSMMDQVPTERYPFTSINRVSWNPNARSFQWLAVAYQNGFVRCIPFSFLDPEGNCDKLIERHVENLNA